MALEDPYDPRVPLDPYGMQMLDQPPPPPPWAVPPPDEVASTLGPRGGSSEPIQPPTPQLPPTATSTMGPRGRNNLAAQGQPTGDEVPYGAVPPPLTLEEQAQIQIDPQAPPQLGETPPEYVGHGAPPELASLQHTLSPDFLQAPPDAITGDNAAPPSDTPIRNTGEDITNDYLAHPEKIVTDEIVAQRGAANQFNHDYINGLEEQRQKRQQDNDAYMAAMAKGAQMAQDIANTKIDPDGWWHSRSTGQKVAGVLAAVLGGLGQMQNGGRNIGMEQINKAIDDDMQAQTQNLANRRSALSDFYQQTGNMAIAKEKYRAGVWNDYVAKLQAEQQNYDQNGTTYRDIATRILQGRAQVHAASRAAEQLDIKNSIDGYKAYTEGQDKLAAARKSDAETKKILGQVGGGGSSKDNMTVEQLAAQYPGMPLPPPAAFTGPGKTITLKGFKAWQGITKEGNDIVSGQKEVAAKQTANEIAEAKNSVTAPIQTGVDKNGEPLLVTKKMTNKDGTTWRPPDKFQTMLAHTTSVNRIADKLTREIDQWGGQSNLVKSDHWQTLKGDYADLVQGLHGAKGIEGFRPGTAELLHDLTGNVDPTSFVRDARAGIQNMKQNINDDLNDAAVAGNYDGPRVQFLDTHAPPPPKPTPATTAAATLAGSVTARDVDSLGPLDRAYALLKDHEPGAADLISRPDWRAQYATKYAPYRINAGALDDPELQRALSVGIAPSQLAVLDELNAAATGADPKAKKAALDALTAQMLKNNNGAIREYARHTINSIGIDAVGENTDSSNK